VPFAWVTADSVYGVGEIEMKLRQKGKGYVLGVNANSQFNSWGRQPVVAGTAEAIANTFAPAAWQRLSAGEGTQGARLYDWAYLELADLGADGYNPGLSGTWTRGLLIRRSIADNDLAYFTTWCPAGTSMETLVGVEGRRWAIEDSFETAKTELGLDHNESRSWHGWHRHVSLVMLAFAMLATIRHHANQPDASQTPIRLTQGRKSRSSAGRSRKSAALPHVLRSGVFRPHTLSPGRSGSALTRPPPSAPI
jgi:SRSO17 transposase